MNGGFCEWRTRPPPISLQVGSMHPTGMHFFCIRNSTGMRMSTVSNKLE